MPVITDPRSQAPGSTTPTEEPPPPEPPPPSRARKRAEQRRLAKVTSRALPLPEEVDLNSLTSGRRLLTWRATVDSVTLRLIVDSGATSSCISPAAARTMRQRKLKRPIPVTYSNGERGGVTHTVTAPLEADDPQWSCTHRFLVLPLPDEFDAIVGLDFIDRFWGMVGKPDAKGWVMDLLKVGLRFPLEGGLQADAVNMVDTVDPLEATPADDDTAIQWLREGAEGYLVHASPDHLRGVTDTGEMFAFVRASGADEAAQLRADLDSMERAVDPSTVPSDDLQRINDRLDDIPAELSEATAAQRDALLAKFEARGFFEEPSFDSVKPRDDMVDPLRITAEGLAKPPYQPPRRLNAAKLESLKKYLEELLARGFIQPSSSSYGAPVLLVVKADGTFRFTVDYRALNSVLEMDKFGLPRADQILQQAAHAKAKIFSSVDAFHSFWQIRLREEDRHKTAMSTPFGLYEWLVCPQGLATSPSQLQRVLTAALGDLVGTVCAVYVDDILIFSQTPEEHVVHLEQVFSRLHDAQIRIKRKKSKFFMSSLEYLGLQLSAAGTAPTTEKLRHLLEFPKPTGKDDVKSLLGVVSWLRDFVPHVVTWCKPLQDLANSRQPWTDESWTEEHQHCLRVLLHLLTTEPILQTPNPSRPFAIMTDASQYALGCVLMQQETDEPHSRWHPVAYHSKALKARKRHLSATDREMLGIIAAVKKWQHLLLDQQTLTIFGDHKPLSYYRTMDLSQGHQLILRQLDLLEALRTDIVYVTAKEVAIADLLSRDKRLLPMMQNDNVLQHPVLRFADPLPPDALDAEHIQLICCPMLTRRQRAASTADFSQGGGAQDAQDDKPPGETTEDTEGVATHDDDTGEIDLSEIDLTKSDASDAFLQPPLTEALLDHSARKDLETETQLSPFWAKATGRYGELGLSRQHGLAFYTDAAGRRRLFLPPRWRSTAMAEAHDAPMAGHLGHKRTYDRLARAFWWPTMKADARRYCRECTVCLTIKPARGHMGLLQPLPVPFRKWSHVAMDLVSIPGGGTYKSALVVCDRLTKRIRVFPLQAALDLDVEKDVAPAAKLAAEVFLEHVWKHHGLPTRIVSDRDPRFTSGLWQHLWEAMGTKLNMSTAGYAQTDGLSERSIRTFVQMLRAYSTQHRDWERLAPALEYAYNDAIHESTGHSPFELEYGQAPYTPLQMALGLDSDPAATGPAKFRVEVSSRLKEARRIVREQQAKTTSYYNKKVVKDTVVAGDWVLLANSDRKNKLQPLWVGPFRVTEVKGKVVSLARASRRLFRVNMSACRLLPRKPMGTPQVRAVRQHQVLEDNGNELTQLELLVDAGWEPASTLVPRYREAIWTQLIDRLDAATDLSMAYGDDAVGSRITKVFPGHGPADGVICEFDAAEQASGGASYRVAYVDDDEDLTEGEYERVRRAWIRAQRKLTSK